ncbi:hypothetical protein CKF46_37295, partial [Klebsiella pneumoniae]
FFARHPGECLAGTSLSKKRLDPDVVTSHVVTQSLIDLLVFFARHPGECLAGTSLSKKRLDPDVVTSHVVTQS